MADLRFAAWFLWMTPLLTALSRARDAACSSATAPALSPVSAASRNLRTEVFSELLTALLRRRAFSFVLLRLIWLLMLATAVRNPSQTVRWTAWTPSDRRTSRSRLAAAGLAPGGKT